MKDPSVQFLWARNCLSVLLLGILWFWIRENLWSDDSNKVQSSSCLLSWQCISTKLALLLWLMQDDDVGAIQSLKKTLRNCAFCLAVAAAIALPNLLPNPSILAAEWVAAIADNVGVNINAGSPSKDDAEGLLRSALPIHNKPIREIQTVLERTYGDLAVTTDDVKTIPGTIEEVSPMSSSSFQMEKFRSRKNQFGYHMRFQCFGH